MNLGRDKIVWDENVKLLKMIEKAKQYNIPFTKDGKASWGDRFNQKKLLISEKLGDEEFKAKKFDKYGGMKYDKEFLIKLDQIAQLR